MAAFHMLPCRVGGVPTWKHPQKLADFHLVSRIQSLKLLAGLALPYFV